MRWIFLAAAGPCAQVHQRAALICSHSLEPVATMRFPTLSPRGSVSMVQSSALESAHAATVDRLIDALMLDDWVSPATACHRRPLCEAASECT